MEGAGNDREILLKSSWENAKVRLPWLFASWTDKLRGNEIKELEDTKNRMKKLEIDLNRLKSKNKKNNN